MSFARSGATKQSRCLSGGLRDRVGHFCRDCCRTTVSGAPAPRGEAQAQRIQPDEALGIALVVDRVFLEGDMAEAVEAFGRLPADDAGRALVELEAHDPLDILLALVDQGLQHLALGREPEAVVDE